MKKITVICAFLISLNLSAQDTTYGIKAGLNFSNLTGDLGEDASTKTGIQAGFMLENKTSKKFGITLEFLYSSLGAKGESEGGADLLIKLEYLSFPITFKYYLADNFAIEAGPQIAYQISADLGRIDGTNFNLNEDFKDIDVGLNFGTSLKLDNGIVFGLRYYFGLEDIANNENITGRNRAFTISTGFFF